MIKLLRCLIGFHGTPEIDYTIDGDEILVCRESLKGIKRTCH
jgi:hypothetical protein